MEVKDDLLKGDRFRSIGRLLYGDPCGCRCNGDLADIGDAKASVLMKCGQPFFAESFCKPVKQMLVQVDGTTVVNPSACVMVDEWSYNPGSGSFITILQFEQGVVTGIRYGDRVP